MNQVALEAFLARLYVDAALRAAFLADPRATALGAGLSEQVARGLCEMDFDGLELAAASYAKKRSRAERAADSSWLSRLRSGWRG